MNMPLAGMSTMPRFANSTTGLYMHNQTGISYNGININRSHESHTSSSSGSKLPSKESVHSGGSGGVRLPLSMTASTFQLPPKPLAAFRKTKSVEELDQDGDGFRRNDNKRGYSHGVSGGKKNAIGGSQPSVRAPRGRNASYQDGSETSSFWDVTPPGSTTELDQRLAAIRSKQKPAVPPHRVKPGQRLAEDDEEHEEAVRKPAAKNPIRFHAPHHTNSSPDDDARTESDDYFLDDDDSIDQLDIRHILPKSKNVPPPTVAKKDHSKNVGGSSSKSKAGLQSWLDEQAQLLKEKER